MIILDSNVLSEAMKPKPDVEVLAWLNRQETETLYLSSVTLAELLFGIASLPDGKRKSKLALALDGLLELFDNRILPFDTQAAQYYAQLAAEARRTGFGFPVPDGYIAAIAVANKMRVATRDTGPFVAAGVSFINPWGID